MSRKKRIKKSNFIELYQGGGTTVFSPQIGGPTNNTAAQILAGAGGNFLVPNPVPANFTPLMQGIQIRNQRNAQIENLNLRQQQLDYNIQSDLMDRLEKAYNKLGQSTLNNTDQDTGYYIPIYGEDLVNYRSKEKQFRGQATALVAQGDWTGALNFIQTGQNSLMGSKENDAALFNSQELVRLRNLGKMTSSDLKTGRFIDIKGAAEASEELENWLQEDGNKYRHYTEFYKTEKGKKYAGMSYEFDAATAQDSLDTILKSDKQSLLMSSYGEALKSNPSMHSVWESIVDSRSPVLSDDEKVALIKASRDTMALLRNRGIESDPDILKYVKDRSIPEERLTEEEIKDLVDLTKELNPDLVEVTLRDGTTTSMTRDNAEKFIKQEQENISQEKIADKELEGKKVRADAQVESSTLKAKSKNSTITFTTQSNSDVAKEIGSNPGAVNKARNAGLDINNPEVQNALSDAGQNGELSEDEIKLLQKNQAKSSLNFKVGQEGMRTDRHNNPTAFTTDVAKQAGLVEGIDYEVGDSFEDAGGSGTTARLLKDPIDTTIKVIDEIGFFTQGGKPRWASKLDWKALEARWKKANTKEKQRIVAEIYQAEGGNGQLVSGIDLTTKEGQIDLDKYNKPGDEQIAREIVGEDGVTYIITNNPELKSLNTATEMDGDQVNELLGADVPESKSIFGISLNTIDDKYITVPKSEFIMPEDIQEDSTKVRTAEQAKKQFGI